MYEDDVYTTQCSYLRHANLDGANMQEDDVYTTQCSYLRHANLEGANIMKLT